jgi:hypothetical protein
VRTRRLASLLAAATVAGIALAGCSEQAAALRVDDVTVSRGDFEDELALYYEKDDLRDFVFGRVDREQLRGELRESYTQEFVAAVAGLRVQFIVAGAVLEDRGLAVGGDARAQAEALIAGQVPDDALSGASRRALVEDVAAFTTLQSELGQQRFGQVMTRALRDADVSVRSQYGSWDSDELAVRPPPGPAEAVVPGPGDAGPAAG